MARYSFAMYERSILRVSFTADNLEHAKKLLQQMISGDLDDTDLPDMDKCEKDYSRDYHPETLKEII